MQHSYHCISKTILLSLIKFSHIYFSIACKNLDASNKASLYHAQLVFKVILLCIFLCASFFPSSARGHCIIITIKGAHGTPNDFSLDSNFHPHSFPFSSPWKKNGNKLKRKNTPRRFLSDILRKKNGVCDRHTGAIDFDQ